MKITAIAQTQHETREGWLNAFVAAVRPQFAEVGYPIPEKVRVAIGWPSAGSKSNAVGECWSDTVSADGSFEIFIIPREGDAIEICDTLTHELVHAAAGLQAKHGPIFRKCATALGLEGKMTSTHGGELWRAWALPLIEALGPFPGAALLDRVPSPVAGGKPTAIKPDGLSSRPPSQTNRHLKLECDACGIILRTTKSTMERIDGDPICIDPICDGTLQS
jgi:hypothetical protein